MVDSPSLHQHHDLPNALANLPVDVYSLQASQWTADQADAWRRFPQTWLSYLVVSCPSINASKPVSTRSSKAAKLSDGFGETPKTGHDLIFHTILLREVFIDDWPIRSEGFSASRSARMASCLRGFLMYIFLNQVFWRGNLRLIYGNVANLYEIHHSYFLLYRNVLFKEHRCFITDLWPFITTCNKAKVFI